MLVGPVAIDGDDDEAEQRQDERQVGGGERAEHRALVDDHGLQRGQHRTAEDGHDESGGAELGIVAQSVERNAVDGGEHERHAAADAHQAVEACTVLQQDDAQREHHGHHAKDGQQLGRLDVFHEPCGHEARADEQHHGIDVELLRQHLGILLAHALGHEHAGAILDDERPAHDLRSHIEELGNDALAVILQREDAAQRGQEVNVAVAVAVLWHLGEKDDEEHGHDDQSNDEVGRDEHAQVLLLHGLKLRVAQQGTLVAAHGVQPRLDEVHGHEHADDAAAGVEALRQVQPSGGALLRSHGQHVGVARGFQERQAAGHDEIGQEETAVDAHRLGRQEQQRAGGVEAQPHQHARLVAVLADENGGGEGHAEVASVESHLHKGAVGDAHSENLREGLHHGVGNVVGKAPQGKAECHKDERQQIAGAVFADNRFFLFHWFLLFTHVLNIR